MHLINDTLYCLLLLSRHVQHGMLEGLCFSSKKVIYDRVKMPDSKELFFCEAVFGDCGFFFLFTLSLAQSGGL